MQQLNSTISRQSIQIAHQAKTQIIHMSFDTKKSKKRKKRKKIDLKTNLLR